jgi:hypothetical protein
MLEWIWTLRPRYNWLKAYHSATDVSSGYVDIQKVHCPKTGNAIAKNDLQILAGIRPVLGEAETISASCLSIN